MASPGWANIGSVLAGGNTLNSEMAYDQGEALGARTQDALAQARQRVDANNARESADARLAPLIKDPAVRAAIVNGIQGGYNPEQTFASLKTNQDNNFAAGVADPTTSPEQTARNLLAMGKSANFIHPNGDAGNFVNELEPGKGVQMSALGTQMAQAKIAADQALVPQRAAATAKTTDEVAHPEKYRMLPPAQGAATGEDGSAPTGNETTAQLVAAGMMPMPQAGTKAYMMLGGDSFVRRVNFLAGHPPGSTPPAGGAAPAVPGAPPVAAGVKLPEPAPQGPAPTFDANAYGVRRTALNDLSRKNGTGGNNDALNRTAGHLDVYEQLLQNSGNTNFVAGNQLKNWFQQQTGQAYPGNAELAAHILGTEIVRSMTSVGAGSADERMGLATQFSNAKSSDQAKGAIDTAQRLLREQAVATNARETASGVKDYYSKYLTPTTRRRLSLDSEAVPAGGAAPPVAGAAPMSLDAYLKQKGF